MKATEVYNENNIVKTESGETAKVETTKVENKGKYVAASLAGLVTSGGFMAFALQEEDVTNDDGTAHDTYTENAGAGSIERSRFEQAFADARIEQGKGGVFEHEGNFYGTYYKDEWDALSKEEKDQFYASVNSKIQAMKADEADETNATDTAGNDPLPEETAGAQVEVIRMASQITDDMPQEMALYAAREEVGPGNIYKWHGEVYSTYTADELLELSPEEIERARYIMEQVNLSEQTLTKADIQGEETIFDPQSLIADTEITDTEAIVNTTDTDADAVADITGEQIDYNENEDESEGEGEESIDVQDTEGSGEIEYVVNKLPLLSSSDDDADDDSQVLESSDADADTDFDNPINDSNDDMNLADNL
jgi:hypothetical protein